MDYEKASRDELVALFVSIRDSLVSADNAEDFCLWLASKMGVDIRAKH